MQPRSALRKALRPLLAVAGLSACAPMGGASYDVTVTPSGNSAFVQATGEPVTIAGIERAASRAAPWGCEARAAEIFYTDAGGDRESELPARSALRFANRYPVVLTC